MEGPLPSNRRLRLIERTDPLGELCLKRCVLSPQSFRIRLEAQRPFLPAKRFAVELLGFSEVVVRIRAEALNQHGQLVEVGLINLNRATTVDHARDERVRFALVFGGRSTLAIAKQIVAAEHHSSSGSREPPPMSVVACRVVSIPEPCPDSVDGRPSRPPEFDPNNFWLLCSPLLTASDVSCFGLRPLRTVDSVSLAPIKARPSKTRPYRPGSPTRSRSCAEYDEE